MSFLKTVFPLSLLLCLVACGGSTKSGDFTLTATPSTLALTIGSSTQLTVSATATGGLPAPITLTLSNLPAGVSASPASLSLTPGTPATLTLTTTAAALPATNTITLTGTSRSLTHTASVTLSVTAAPPPPSPPPAPPPPPPSPTPDFSLSLSPNTETIVAGSTGTPVAVTATAANGFTGNITVTLSGLPTGVTAAPATLMLVPSTPQTLTLTAVATAPAATGTATLTATSGTLSHTAVLALTITAAPPPVPTGQDVTTYHYRNSRDGLNAAETTLTLANVNAASFGLRGLYPVDGRVDAQPLYISGLTLPSGAHNVLYVATEHDSLYALDAATGAQLWKTSLLGAGESTSDNHNCGQITPEIGITSTPVIDRSHGPHGAIFLVAMTKDAANAYHQRLHALDLVTGAELPASPTEITATYPGTGAASQNGIVPFDPAQYAERAGLLLLNGAIYTTWTSHCDDPPYTGWVMGFSENTLAQTTVLNLTPNGSDGSVWMSGYGLAADATGNIYFLDANGTLDPGFAPNGFPSQNDFGNAMMKLSTTGGLAVADFFEPYNTVQESGADIDLGSGGAMLLPDLTDASGATRHLVIGAGKDHNIYLGDRDNLGKFNAAGNTNLYQELPNALPGGAWSGPAYFNNTVFYAGVGDTLKAYTLTNARLGAAPASQSAVAFPYPGATPAVSANGTANAIVWALESPTNGPAVLHAFDATDLTQELYNSSQAPNNRDAFGIGNKFLTPMIVNGQVFVGTPNSVAVFGLLSP